jgi:alpha-beta hydrolase superfamily lysophospholipase
VYFPSGQHTLFGWIHPARGPAASDLGIVICNPFGYETICAHKSLLAFAEACAATGVSALRFDYRGTGDSSSTGGEEDQISAWCEDIRAAIEFLQRTCSVRRICLLGVRLGALLATRVAAQHNVDSLIAVAPVVSGKRYLRELRAFQATASAGGEGGAGSDAASADDPDGGMEVAGFPLFQSSLGSLKQLDVSKLPDGPKVAALIVDRDDLPGTSSWSASLASKGVDVQYTALPGFSQMVSTPHESVVPVAIVDAVSQWLRRHVVTAPMANQASPLDVLNSPVDIPNEPRMRMKHDSGVELVERAVSLDREGVLFGIVTEPAARADRAEAYGVILLNTGATSHVGPNRMYVELCRRWAARGYVALRFDLAGLGDSAARAGEKANQVYPPGALDDVRRAIDFMRERLHTRNITLAGVCAGAYHGLRSAVAGLPVNTVLLVNPLTFYWKQGSTLSDLQISEVVRNPGVYARNAFSSRHWLKLVRGRVNLWRAGKVFFRRGWLSVESALRNLCRALRLPLPDDLGWDLKGVTARGVRVVFVFARGDAGHQLLRLQGGSSVARLGDSCRIHVINHADHIFTQRPARGQLMDLLSDELPADSSTGSHSALPVRLRLRA